MAIRNQDLWRQTTALREMHTTLAGLGHHQESSTPEYRATAVLAATLADDYADDSYNQQRFLTAAGYQTSRITGGTAR
jgi:hypothetical protein